MPDRGYSKQERRMNEVNLNDPLNWYVADSVDDYDVRIDPATAKAIVHRHNAYPRLVNALREAITFLESEGHAEKAKILRQELKDLGEAG